jgi:hypothetical protein
VAAVEELVTERLVLDDLLPVCNYAHFQHYSN